MTLSLGLTDLQLNLKPTEVNKGLLNNRLQIRTLLPDSSLALSNFIEILHQCKAMKKANEFPVFKGGKSTFRNLECTELCVFIFQTLLWF